MKAGEQMSDAQRQKLRVWNTGRTMSDEARGKMRLSAYSRVSITKKCVICGVSFIAKSGATKYCELHTAAARRDYERELLAATSVCDICTEMRDELMIDHCHECGVFRGILCRKCNLGLGWFNDNYQLLELAMKYIKAPPRIDAERRLYSGWRGIEKVTSCCTPNTGGDADV